LTESAGVVNPHPALTKNALYQIDTNSIGAEAMPGQPVGSILRASGWQKRLKISLHSELI
jgi:hypothetical protein